MTRKKTIYPNEWMQIHPYTQAQPSDAYYVELANRLYTLMDFPELPDAAKRKLALYLPAYLEDLVSGLNLWNCFRQEHQRLYRKPLPFYVPAAGYEPEEPNREDLCFIIWNTWQKALYPHGFIHPEHTDIIREAARLIPVMEEAYEEAPENEMLNGYFRTPGGPDHAEKKLNWLFGHTYLTEPGMLPYIDRIQPNDRFIMPTGPLALFLSEWIDSLSDDNAWKSVPRLYTPDSPVPASLREKNRTFYELFTAHTHGHPVVYLDGYAGLRRFLVEVLKWKDDENHTLPHLKAHRNFILMTHPEKGILLAKDIAELIADRQNPLYDRVQAEQRAFSLLTEETLCPPDLLTYCITHHLLPDACIPGSRDTATVQENADFIARHSLLYYYRGD